MNKLLRLYCSIYFKEAFKILGSSLLITLGARVFFNIDPVLLPAVASFSFIFMIFFLNKCNTILGDNLSWLNLAPVSKKQLLTYKMLFSILFYLFTALISLLISLVGMIILQTQNLLPDITSMSMIFSTEYLASFYLLLEKEKHLTQVPSALISVIVIMFSIAFMRSFFFRKSQLALYTNLGQVNDRKTKMITIGIFLLLALLFNIYDTSVLLITSVILGAMSYAALCSIKRELVLVHLKQRYIVAAPLVLMMVYFVGIKSYSDSLLSNPKLSLSRKLQEIQFQMRFSSYLDQKKMIEFLHAGISNYDYLILTAVYDDWGAIKSFFNNNKNEVFSTLISGQKDPKVLEKVLILFEAKYLNVSDVDSYLAALTKLDAKNKAIQSRALNHLQDVPLSRTHLMNYLVSGDPLKQYLAVSFGSKHELNLVPEIIKNVSSFNDETLSATKQTLSSSYCRRVSSMEILNAHKAQATALESHCKIVGTRLPATSTKEK